MRINKYIAQAGIASRRKADELLKAGNIKVNGAVMKELGYDVKPDDLVEVNGIRVKSASRPVYVMLNKPKGFITSTEDEQSRPTVMELVKDIDERVFPVGRLDYNTSGLLLMTNDGELAYILTHPQHKIYKTYRAKVSGHISEERMSKLRKGVKIGDFTTSPAKVKLIKQSERSALVEIQIYEGRNRQVRKMFSAIGNKVVDLQRVAIGDLYLGHLKEGHYRKLTREEVQYLKNSRG